jgi:hypothetical protein
MITPRAPREEQHHAWLDRPGVGTAVARVRTAKGVGVADAIRAEAVLAIVATFGLDRLEPRSRREAVDLLARCEVDDLRSLEPGEAEAAAVRERLARPARERRMARRDSRSAPDRGIVRDRGIAA